MPSVVVRMSSVSSSSMRTVSRISRSEKLTRSLPSHAVHEAEDALVHDAHGEVLGAREALERGLEGVEARAGLELDRQDHVEVALDDLLRDVVDVALVLGDGGGD